MTEEDEARMRDMFSGVAHQLNAAWFLLTALVLALNGETPDLKKRLLRILHTHQPSGPQLQASLDEAVRYVETLPEP